MRANEHVKVEEVRLEVGNAQLHAERIRPTGAGAGRDPALVLLHEALGCVARWREFPARLAARSGLEALIYDRQGHGRSSMLQGPRSIRYLHEEALTVLPEVLHICEIDNAILIGHSDGGSIALIFAAAHPQKTTAVITEAAHVMVEEITLRGIRSKVAEHEGRDLAHRLRKYHGDHAASLFENWAEIWLSPEFRVWNIEELLAEIRCPVLALQGAEDEYGSAAQIQSIAGKVSGRAEALLIPDCGHIPHQQCGDLILERMAAFIGTVYPPPAPPCPRSAGYPPRP